MESVTDAFAWHVSGFPLVDGLPGWRSNSPNYGLRDFWYVGTSSEAVDQAMAAARFVRDYEDVEMPILFKQVFSIDNSTQFLGWARVCGNSQHASLQLAKNAAWGNWGNWRW